MSTKTVLVKLRDGENYQEYHPFIFRISEDRKTQTKMSKDKNIGHPFKIDGTENFYVSIKTDVEDKVETNLEGTFPPPDKNWKYPFEYIISWKEITNLKDFLVITITDKEGITFIIRIPIVSEFVLDNQYV